MLFIFCNEFDAHNIHQHKMVSLKELRADAKQRGLKRFSLMKKAELLSLLAMDDVGNAPTENMTAKRQKQLRDTIAEEQPESDGEPAEVDAEGQLSPELDEPEESDVESAEVDPPPPQKRLKRGEVLKLVKAKRDAECKKYAHLAKKTLPQLRALLEM